MWLEGDGDMIYNSVVCRYVMSDDSEIMKETKSLLFFKSVFSTSTHMHTHIYTMQKKCTKNKNDE